MGLGEELRQARLRQKLTASQVASETHMKMQVVEALENEDFAKIAAPIYAKGFIKLYAEHVNLDPAPLIADYMERFAAPRPAPRVLQSEPPPEPEPESSQPEPDLFERDVMPDKERRGILADRSDGVSGPPAGKRAGEWIASLTQRLETAGARMRAATAEAAQRTRAGCRGAWSALTANLKARVSELSQINFKNLTPRHLIALLGVLLLILFVLSSFTRCVRSAVPQKESTPEGAGALPMAVDPPDAYIQ